MCLRKAAIVGTDPVEPKVSARAETGFNSIVNKAVSNDDFAN
jgi:hypothetical protein